MSKLDAALLQFTFDAAEKLASMGVHRVKFCVGECSVELEMSPPIVTVSAEADVTTKAGDDITEDPMLYGEDARRVPTYRSRAIEERK